MKIIVLTLIGILISTFAFASWADIDNKIREMDGILPKMRGIAQVLEAGEVEREGETITLTSEQTLQYENRIKVLYQELQTKMNELKTLYQELP